MDLGRKRACEPLTPAKHLYQMNNNLCIYYKDANYHAKNSLKVVNRKTLLRKIVVSSDKCISFNKMAFLITLLLINLENL